MSHQPHLLPPSVYLQAPFILQDSLSSRTFPCPGEEGVRFLSKVTLYPSWQQEGVACHRRGKSVSYTKELSLEDSSGLHTRNPCRGPDAGSSPWSKCWQPLSTSCCPQKHILYRLGHGHIAGRRPISWMLGALFCHGPYVDLRMLPGKKAFCCGCREEPSPLLSFSLLHLICPPH